MSANKYGILLFFYLSFVGVIVLTNLIALALNARTKWQIKNHPFRKK
jgi:hypothetical protein